MDAPSLDDLLADFSPTKNSGKSPRKRVDASPRAAEKIKPKRTRTSTPKKTPTVEALDPTFSLSLKLPTTLYTGDAGAVAQGVSAACDTPSDKAKCASKPNTALAPKCKTVDIVTGADDGNSSVDAMASLRSLLSIVQASGETVCSLRFDRNGLDLIQHFLTSCATFKIETATMWFCDGSQMVEGFPHKGIILTAVKTLVNHVTTRVSCSEATFTDLFTETMGGHDAVRKYITDATASLPPDERESEQSRIREERKRLPFHSIAIAVADLKSAVADVTPQKASEGAVTHFLLNVETLEGRVLFSMQPDKITSLKAGSCVSALVNRSVKFTTFTSEALWKDKGVDAMGPDTTAFVNVDAMKKYLDTARSAETMKMAVLRLGDASHKPHISGAKHWDHSAWTQLFALSAFRSNDVCGSITEVQRVVMSERMEGAEGLSPPAFARVFTDIPNAHVGVVAAEDTMLMYDAFFRRADLVLLVDLAKKSPAMLVGERMPVQLIMGQPIIVFFTPTLNMFNLGADKVPSHKDGTTIVVGNRTCDDVQDPLGSVMRYVAAVADADGEGCDTLRETKIRQIAAELKCPQPLAELDWKPMLQHIMKWIQEDSDRLKKLLNVYAYMNNVLASF